MAALQWRRVSTRGYADIAAHHSENHDERRLLLALSLTGGFMIVEVIGGLWSGSLALLADAGHMFTDTVSLGLAWLAARLSRRPADERRTYGYHRLQILAAFVNGIFFLFIVAWIGFEAVQRLLTPQPVLGGVMLWVALAGLGINVLAFVLLHGGHHHNLNVRAALLHVMGDLLGSLAAIVAAGVILATGWYPIDPLLSILVALLILYSAWKVVRQSGHILLEGTPTGVDPERIRAELHRQIPEIEDVHHLHVWSLTPDRPMLTLHVTVAADVDCGWVLGRVKRTLQEVFGIDHSTVQVETAACIDEALADEGS